MENALTPLPFRAAERPRPGDPVLVQRRGYAHAALYVGRAVIDEAAGIRRIAEDMVVHLDGKATDPRVALSPFSEVVGDGVWTVPRVQPAFPAPVIVQRGLGKVGRPGYNLFHNNCEHFVSWCITGEARSPQIDHLKRVATKAAGLTLAAAGTALALAAGARAAGTRAARRGTGREVH
ncbi:MAG: lecithin retinol acyltransferase family protein [Phycisphaerales bacterium]|nr:lecithin retinol acyltransferase family protein [Phycisphaerales bacterium]